MESQIFNFMLYFSALFSKELSNNQLASELFTFMQPLLLSKLFNAESLTSEQIRCKPAIFVSILNLALSLISCELDFWLKKKNVKQTKKRKYFSLKYFNKNVVVIDEIFF